MKWNTRTFTELIASLLILLYVYTAISKFSDLEKFRIAIASSKVLRDYASFIAWLIPSVEIIISTLLIFPRTKFAGLFSSLVLMSVFTIYISYMLITASQLPCSCGGVISGMTWTQHLIFNVSICILNAAAFWLTYRHQRFIAINRLSRTPVQDSRHHLLH